MDIQRVKRLRRNLTLHFSVIACITAILVANNGSGSIFLPALILLVTTTAYILVERLEVFYLGQVGSYVGMTLATLIALVSLVISAFESNESSQLLSVAGLLIYPQCVLFFQKKSLRVFEQLAVFLLLQMIVAALINDNIIYGFLLTPMLLAWVSSLFLFARYATIVSLAPEIEEPVPLLYELLYAKYVRPALRGKKNVATTRAVAIVEPAMLNARGRQRWLLSAPLGISALLFGGSLFYFLPRNGQSGALASLSLDKTGLPDSINPGFFGRVLSDPTPILRLKLSKDGKPFLPLYPPYLRVDVFDRYTPPQRQRANGNWHRTSGFDRKSGPVELQLANRDRVKVDIKGKNIPGGRSSKILASVPPIVDEIENFSYDRSMMIFEQINEMHTLARKKYLQYNYVTAAFANGKQIEITPDSGSSPRNALTYLSVSLPGVNRIRQRVLAPVDQSNAYAVAKTLESHFRDTGEYKYSLNVPPLYEPTIDPIEDFIVNTKTGLCQHYASALVAMLRQSGIPSRIVIGYRPVEWNKLGDFCNVRMSDAHAWVEALIKREDLVGTENETWLTNEDHYWLHLDPTPASSSDVEIREQNKPLDYAEELWDDYLAYPEASSLQASYAPMTTDSQAQAQVLMATLGRLSKAIFGETFAGLGFAWQLTLAIIILGGLPVLIWQVIRWLPRLAPNLAFRLGMRRPIIQQAFYARCVELLESLRIKRPESETLQEFSERARETIESRTQPSGSLRQSLQALGDLYHRIRFSPDKTVEHDELNPIEQHLEAVELAVKAARKRP